MSVDLDILSWLDEEDPVPALEVRSVKADSLTASEASGTCFEIQREVLLSLMDKAIGLVPSRDMIPALTNFQFVVAENKLKIIASTSKISIVVSTEQVHTKVAGIEVFPARTLFNVVKESSVGSTIYIEATESGAVVVSGGFSAEIAMMSGKGFPKMESISDVEFHEVNRLDFLNAINTVKYALPDKDYSGQAAMKMINIKGGKFTACDGSRFQQVRIDGFKLSMKLPALSISHIAKIFSTSDIEILEIGETSNDKLVFRLGNVLLYVNKLDDAYPNVEQLWLRPALSNDQELLVDRQELITAIKQVRFAADPDSNAIALVLEPDVLTLTTKGITNSASGTINCSWVGKKRTVVVNCFHLAEMLKAYSQKECKFLLAEDTKLRKSPMLLKDSDTLAIATIPQLLKYRAGLDS